ncbi:hypothetical protein [Sphingosinicella ginsenosidimutans]|nr:hypothetical protein [Sphingosinicella ginsenosidimutans]
MKQKRTMLRPATLALFASVACFNAPVFAQSSVAAPPPVEVAPPSPVTSAPPGPPVVNVTPAPVQASPAPRPAVTPRLQVALPPAEAESPPARVARTAPRVRSAPARAAAPARAPVRAAPPPVADAAPVEAPPPAAEAPVAAPPPAAEPAPLPVEEPAAPATQTSAQRINPLWYGLIALAALAILGLFVFRRRRVDEAAYDEPYYEAPAADVAADPAPFVADPVIAAEPVPVVSPRPVAAEAVPDRANVSLAAPDAADIEALAATSAPTEGRPWIELLLRPIRAGTSREDAIVQFELTVGNTGSVPARDVRISTWMMAGDATDMERSLITAPADARVSELDIPAGDGTKIEAEIAIPKAGLGDSVLPIVAAEARYRLPDGREGRTAASFAIGRADEEGLHPFPADRASGLLESVGAELHGEPERV